MLDVFISYSRRNLEFIQQLANVLIQTDKDIWFDKSKEPLQGIPAGSRWWDEIQHGIETADNFLFVISPESIASPYCNAEIAYALRNGKRIVTVLLSRSASQGETIRAIDTSIDEIGSELELPLIPIRKITCVYNCL